MQTVETHTLLKFPFGVLAAQPPEVLIYKQIYVYIDIDKDIQYVDG